MSMALINERLMQSVQVGLAIVEPLTCQTLFSNNHFNSWFGVNEDLPLGVFVDIQQVSEILSNPPEVLPGKNRHCRETQASRICLVHSFFTL